MDRRLQFSSIDQGLAEAGQLVAAGVKGTAGFTLSQTLVHCAQSIDYSMDGFPALKPALFRVTVGAAAFAVFSWRGRMSHGLAEPIPDAPSLDLETDPGQALARLRTSANRFEQHGGALAPHFAYGRLDKRQYALANAMHMANHFSVIKLAG